MLKKFGGHSQAGGFTAPCDNEADFQQQIITTAKKITPVEFIPVLSIDYELEQPSIPNELYATLQQLEPFGEGNHEPVFLMRGVAVHNQEVVGRQQSHLKLYLESGGVAHTAIGFGFAFCREQLSVGQKIDVAFCLRMGDDNKHTLELIDIKLHDEN